MDAKDNQCQQITKSMPAKTDCTVFITMIIMLNNNSLSLNDIQTCLSTKNIINKKKKQLLNSQAEKVDFIKFIYIKRQIFNEIIEVVDKFDKRKDNNIDESELKGIITEYYNKNKLNQWAFVKFPKCLFWYLFKYDSYSYNDIFLSTNSTQITEQQINEIYETIVREETTKAAQAAAVQAAAEEEARRAAEEARRAAEEATAVAAAADHNKTELERIISNEIKEKETLTKSRLQEIIGKIMENINSGGLTLDKDIIANKIVSDILVKHVKVKLFQKSSDNTDNEKVKTLIKNFIDLYTKFGKDGCESIKEILLKARSSIGGNQELTISLVNNIITKLDSLSLGLDDAAIKDRIVECLQIVDIGTSKITDKGKKSLPDLITKIIEEYRKAAQAEAKRAAAEAEAKRAADEEDAKRAAAEAEAKRVAAEAETKRAAAEAEAKRVGDTVKVSPTVEASPVETSSKDVEEYKEENPELVSSLGLGSGTGTEAGLGSTPVLSSITPPTNIIKITENKLTKKISSEFVSTREDDSENSSTKIIFFEISNEFCQEIKKLYTDSTKTTLGSKKFSNEELKKLFYRITLSKHYIHNTKDVSCFFLLCYLLTIINVCACNKCIQPNNNFIISKDEKTNLNYIEDIKLAIKLSKLFYILFYDKESDIYKKLNENTFKLYMIDFICLFAFDGEERESEDTLTNTIKLIFFNGNKFYNTDIFEEIYKNKVFKKQYLSNGLSTELPIIIKSTIPIIYNGIQKFKSYLTPKINLSEYLVNNSIITYPNFKRIIELIIDNSPKNKLEEDYINSDSFNSDFLYWLIAKNCYSIDKDNLFLLIFPTSTSEDYITSETVKGIKEEILAYNRYIKTDPACSSISKIIKELNINDYNITEDLLKKIIVKYAVKNDKNITPDNLWKCLFEHGIYTYNDEDKSIGSQEEIDIFKTTIASLIESSEITEEGEGSIKAEKDKIKAAAEESGRTESEAKRTAEEEKTKAATEETKKQEADLKTYQNTSLQLWDYLKSQKSEFIKYNETEKTYTVKNQGKINVSFEGSKAVSFDVSLTIKQDGANYIDTLTLSKNTLAQQGGNKNYSKKKLKRKISKRKNKKRKISKKKKRNNISNKKIYIGGEPTVYNLKDLYLLQPPTLLQGNFTSNTIRLLDSSDGDKIITLNFFAMSNSSAVSSPLYKAINKFYEFKDSSEVLTAIAALKKEKEEDKSCNDKEYFIVKTKSRDNWRNSTNILYSYTTIIAKNKLILLYPDVIDKNSDKIYEYTTPEKIMKKFKIDIYDFDDLTLKIEKKDSLQFKLIFSPKTNNPKLIKKFTLDLSTLPNKNIFNRCEEKCADYIAYPVVNYLCCKIETTEDRIASVSSSTSSSLFSRGKEISSPVSSKSSAPESSFGRAMGRNSSIVCINVGDYVSEGGNEVISDNPGESETSASERSNESDDEDDGKDVREDEEPGDPHGEPGDPHEEPGDPQKNKEPENSQKDEDDDLRHQASLYGGGDKKKLNNNKRLTKKKKYKGGVCIKQIDPRILSKDLQDKIKLELGIETIGGKTKKCYKRKKNKRKTIRK
jgi:regulator of protease activity HflC (stomatin/prohibitin superfamily)